MGRDGLTNIRWCWFIFGSLLHVDHFTLSFVFSSSSSLVLFLFLFLFMWNSTYFVNLSVLLLFVLSSFFFNSMNCHKSSDLVSACKMYCLAILVRREFICFHLPVVLFEIIGWISFLGNARDSFYVLFFLSSSKVIFFKGAVKCTIPLWIFRKNVPLVRTSLHVKTHISSFIFFFLDFFYAQSFSQRK